MIIQIYTNDSNIKATELCSHLNAGGVLPAGCTAVDCTEEHLRLVAYHAENPPRPVGKGWHGRLKRRLVAALSETS